jgi:TolA-binding protein
MPIARNYFVFHRVIFFILLFLFIPISRSFAGPGAEPATQPLLVIDSDKQFEFAEHYFFNKEYLSAVDEFKRFVYFFPKDERVEMALFKIGMSYFYSKHYAEAIGAFNALIEEYGETELAVQSYLMISESHMGHRAYGAAVIILHNLITITAKTDVRDEAYYRIGWIYVETANWEKARRYFSKISTQNQDKYRLKKLSEELDKEKLIPEKSPRLAGFLSVIPGAGFFYCERYQDALVAFLLNGGLIWAAYESFDEEHYALGALITFVEVGFYAGNIYGAINSAHKYNRNHTRRFIEEFKENRKLKLSAGFKNQGVCLSLQLSF